jgi:hypothetical protein
MKILAFDIGIKNLAFCAIDDNQITKWKILDISADNFNNTSKNLIASLHDEFPECIYDVVLIENQPTLQNPTMKSIQMLIYSYFLIQTYQTGSNCDVKLVSPNNKLKVKLNTSKEKLSYKKKKQYSIELTKLYLQENHKERIEEFSNCKKRDDLADCFLYCVNYLEYNKLL